MPTTFVNPYLQQYIQTLQQLSGQMPQPAMQAQPVTPPVIHTDFIVMDSIDAIRQTPVSVGQTMGFILKDESVIVHKTGTQTGATYEYWDRRPPEPPEEDKYVTKDQLNELIAALTAKKEDANGVS